MHIPDGYLSPGTAGTLYAMVIPFWITASVKLKRLLSGRTIPLMSLISAFCFVVQMINIPLPGGTTGHAVGASLAAIVLTPWPAVLSVSIALLIQALFFGDGGITAYGANCFNMAVLQVWISYYIYSTISPQTIRGKGWAAAIAGYVSANIAALATGIQLGLQPLLAQGPDGTPLYAPYPLSISVPAMVGAHLVAGLAEAVVCGATVVFLSRSVPELLQRDSHVGNGQVLPLFWSRLRLLWLGIGVLTILTPLGLLAPGTAWGEWNSQQLQQIGLGFVPNGMKKWENLWGGIFADYSIPGLGDQSGYILSAMIGMALILLVFWMITAMGRRMVARDVPPGHGNRDHPE